MLITDLSDEMSSTFNRMWPVWDTAGFLHSLICADTDPLSPRNPKQVIQTVWNLSADEKWVSVCFCVQHSLMIAMRELKLPMLKHSWATSMKNSMIRALCFFFTGCNERTQQRVNQRFYKYMFLKHNEHISRNQVLFMLHETFWVDVLLSIVKLSKICVWFISRSNPACSRMKLKPANEQQRVLAWAVPLSTTYHTDLSGHQVTQSVEPVDVRLQVTGFTLPKETLTNKRREMTWSVHMVVHTRKRTLFNVFRVFILCFCQYIIVLRGVSVKKYNFKE